MEVTNEHASSVPIDPGNRYPTRAKSTTRGKIVEDWEFFDQLGIFQAIGPLPTPKANAV